VILFSPKGFGAPAAPQQSLFGGGSPGFGQPAAPAFGGGGLFGAKPAAPVGGSLFGAPAPAPGLFGAQSQAPGLFSGGLGSSFGGGLSTASQQQQQQPPYQQQQQQQQLYASVDDNAYGSNPLFANIGAQAIPVNVLDSKKKPPISTAFRATPKSSSKITRLRGFGSSSLSSPGLNLSMNQSPRSLTSSILGTPGSNGRGSPLNLISGIGEEALLSSNAFVSRPSVKKLVIDKKVMGEASLAKSRNRSTLGATVSPQAAPPQRDSNSTGAAFKTKDRVTFNPDLDFSTSRSQYTVAPSSLRGPDTFGSSTPVKKVSHLSQQQRNESFESTPPPLSSSLHGLVNDESISSALDTTNDLPAHGEYYTIPSIKHLYKLPAAKLQSFPDLVVGRVGYGKVSFHDSVNLTTLSSVDRLLGDVIIFEDRNCTVYPPDYEGKPSPGDGLNVPATIQLERCWPVSKSTREPIKAEADPKLISHIKRLRNLEGTRFVDFESETGKWTFEVEGF
jgi:nuclear pore complex protein Nup98-Nup96